MDIQNALKSTSARACRFYLFYLQYFYKIDVGVRVVDCLSYGESALLGYVRKAIITLSDRSNVNDVCKDLSDAFQTEIFPDKDFYWIKKNERATYYVWGMLKKEHEKLLHEATTRTYSFIAKPLQSLNVNFSKVAFEKVPVDVHQMFEQIVSFFDLHSCIKSSIKTNIFSILKERWGDIYGKRDPFSWIERNNEKMIEWCINYIRTFDFRTDDMFFDVRMIMNPFEHIPTREQYYIPINLNDKCNSIYAFYDLWDAHRDTKKLFLLNINKAWNQKKTRDSRKDKKSINSVVKIETKNKLDYLSTYHNKKINEMLEILIDQAYAQVKINELK